MFYAGIFSFLALLLIASAWYAIRQKDLLYGVIATGVVSLILSVMFLLLQAPDVALTEAAIGIALTTIAFVITIRNTERYENDKVESGFQNKTKEE